MPRFSRIPALMAVGLLTCLLVPASGQEPSPLPLRDVVLFSSGVGYFERAGRVEGAAQVPLSFRAEQINDILKSLVLLDPAGRVQPVTYAGPEITGRRLRFDDPGGSRAMTAGALLRKFQGARVRLLMGAETVEGRFFSVSTKSVPVRDAPPQTVEVINLVTETGLRSVSLEAVTEVKLLDERLDRELREGLAALAEGVDDRRREVLLHFGAAPAREVRAGYLQEVPVWKTSYRLVLDGQDRPFLQGWGIVENTSEEDWRNVRLSLVSGRPISFLQELYQPLYIPRPVVRPQLVASPVPQTYGEVLDTPPGEREEQKALGFGGGMGGLGGGFGGAGGLDAAGRRVSLSLRGIPLRDAISQLFAGSGQQYMVDPNVPNVPIHLSLRDADFMAALRLILRQAAAAVPGLTFQRDGDVYTIRIRQPGLAETPAMRWRAQDSAAVAAESLERSVPAQAEGVERGELFEYGIREPVTILRGRSAMVPIVAAQVEGERLSLYDPASEPRRALLGVRLKNSTGLHLSGGPITVFQGGIYAGDGQIEHVRPGEERLLSYAVDLALTVGHERPAGRQETTMVTAKSGVLTITRRQERENVYTFRNQSDAARTVLVEQPIEQEFRLAEPAQPAERTAEKYRFRVQVPARQSAALKVRTERPVTETLALLQADINVLAAYAQNARVSEKLRAALKQLVARRQRIADLQSQIAEREGEIRTIGQEQARIRENMAQLDRNSPLYQQYVRKLTEQEARIERLRQEIDGLKSARDAAEKELRSFVDSLTVE